MNRTGIDWADYTWNPVTGCRHGCPYCYAGPLTARFVKEGDKPADFTEPRFHVNRVDEPARLSTPSAIFVGSMCDLWGEWVPRAWINAVLRACRDAPQHEYLFLTKNPKRYAEFVALMPPKAWLGLTLDFAADRGHAPEPFTRVGAFQQLNTYPRRFVSLEPVHRNTVAQIGACLEVIRPRGVLVGIQTARGGAYKPNLPEMHEVALIDKHVEIMNRILAREGKKNCTLHYKDNVIVAYRNVIDPSTWQRTLPWQLATKDREFQKKVMA